MYVRYNILTVFSIRLGMVNSKIGPVFVVNEILNEIFEGLATFKKV